MQKKYLVNFIFISLVFCSIDFPLHAVEMHRPFSQNYENVELAPENMYYTEDQNWQNDRPSEEKPEYNINYEELEDFSTDNIHWGIFQESSSDSKKEQPYTNNIFINEQDNRQFQILYQGDLEYSQLSQAALKKGQYVTDNRFWSQSQESEVNLIEKEFYSMIKDTLKNIQILKIIVADSLSDFILEDCTISFEEFERIKINRLCMFNPKNKIRKKTVDEQILSFLNIFQLKYSDLQNLRQKTIQNMAKQVLHDIEIAKEIALSRIKSSKTNKTNMNTELAELSMTLSIISSIFTFFSNFTLYNILVANLVQKIAEHILDQINLIIGEDKEEIIKYFTKNLKMPDPKELITIFQTKKEIWIENLIIINELSGEYYMTMKEMKKSEYYSGNPSEMRFELISYCLSKEFQDLCNTIKEFSNLEDIDILSIIAYNQEDLLKLQKMVKPFSGKSVSMWLVYAVPIITFLTGLSVFVLSMYDMERYLLSFAGISILPLSFGVNPYVSACIALAAHLIFFLSPIRFKTFIEKSIDRFFFFLVDCFIYLILEKAHTFAVFLLSSFSSLMD